MIVLRAALFNLAFYLWTALCAIAALPMLLAPRRSVARFGGWWSGTVLALLRVIVGLDHEVRGGEHLPRGAGIIAIKHQSAWDTLAVAVLIDDPAIVVKQELLWVPLYGWYVLRAGMIAVDRRGGAKALKRLVARARAALAEGRPIVIFPEGTRTAIGQRPPYHPGVAALYSELGLPVVPVAVNSGLFWGRRSFMKRPGRIVLEFLPALPAGLERRRFLAELQDRIEAASARLAAEGRAHAP